MNVHSIIHNSQYWKQSKCLTTKYWINKFVYSMGHYLALKRNKLIHVPTWRNLKSTKLNEIKQTQKTVLYDSIYMQCLEKANL